MPALLRAIALSEAWLKFLEVTAIYLEAEPIE